MGLPVQALESVSKSLNWLLRLGFLICKMGHSTVVRFKGDNPFECSHSTRDIARTLRNISCCYHYDHQQHHYKPCLAGKEADILCLL